MESVLSALAPHHIRIYSRAHKRGKQGQFDIALRGPKTIKSWIYVAVIVDLFCPSSKHVSLPSCCLIIIYNFP